MEDAQAGGPKKRFSDEEEMKFRTKLINKAQELLGLERNLEQDIADMSITGLGELSHVRFESGDTNDGGYYQEFVMRLADKEARQLQEYEAALKRINNGSFGVCAECGSTISKQRLEVAPEVPYCIDCQELKEQRNKSDLFDHYLRRSRQRGFFTGSEFEELPHRE